MTDTPSDAAPPAEVVNLPATVELPKLEPVLLAMLAREVATGGNDLLTTLGHFGLTEPQYRLIEKIPFYAKALEIAIIEWNSITNTKQRMSIEAAWYLERGFPHLAARMMSKDETLNSAIEAGKLFAKVAGIGERTGEAPAGEKFNIRIDLGGGNVLTFEKDVSPTPPRSPGTILENTEGAGSGAAPQPASSAPGEPTAVRAVPEGNVKESGVLPHTEGS